MSTVREILRQKDASKPSLVTISPAANVLQAAKVMNQHRIGSLVVAEADKPAGIITERDVLTRVVAMALDPAATPVSAVMTTPVLCCSLESPVSELRGTMRERRIRHVPVVDGGRLIGMVSIGDLNVAEAEALVRTITTLEEYITRG
ncbi:MAG: CBS domain-containing protein [Phycisphaeraceae bacterium]|nr:CBS domain-containing protein [Phycisphaeraceae bacterium]